MFEKNYFSTTYFDTQVQSLVHFYCILSLQQATLYSHYLHQSNTLIHAKSVIPLIYNFKFHFKTKSTHTHTHASSHVSSNNNGNIVL